MKCDADVRKNLYTFVTMLCEKGDTACPRQIARVPWRGELKGNLLVGGKPRGSGMTEGGIQPGRERCEGY